MVLKVWSQESLNVAFFTQMVGGLFSDGYFQSGVLFAYVPAKHMYGFHLFTVTWQWGRPINVADPVECTGVL